MNVTLFAPPTMLSVGVEAFGVNIAKNMDEAVSNADVIIMLRIQRERMQSFLFHQKENIQNFLGLLLL